MILESRRLWYVEIVPVRRCTTLWVDFLFLKEYAHAVWYELVILTSTGGLQSDALETCSLSQS